MKLNPESIEMLKIFDWVRHNNLDGFTWHMANERRCTPQQGALLKRMGVKAGVSDIFVAKPSQGFGACFIELKAKGGKPSPAQLKFLETMNGNGYLAVIRYGSDEAIATIKEYLNLQP